MYKPVIKPRLIVLNPVMVAKQNLTVRDVQRLIVLHAKKDWIFVRAATGENPHHLIKVLRRVEFAMQAVWKFERDEDRHTWKYLMPNTPINPPTGTDEKAMWVKRYVAAMKLHSNCYVGD